MSAGDSARAVAWSNVVVKRCTSAALSTQAPPARMTHRHQEFLRFLKLIDSAVPKDLDLHLVLDNYATHKTPTVKEWLIRHPRFHVHFTPTSSSSARPSPRWCVAAPIPPR